jgi:hypothetical protein
LFADLLRTARLLAHAGKQRPTQSNLRRAVSTAYYALFHAIAHEGAERFIGRLTPKNRQSWLQCYRALNHGEAKTRLSQVRNLGFSRDLVDVADAFRELQEARHRADCDPTYRLKRSDALFHIALAEAAIAQFMKAERAERLALMAHLLLRGERR